MNKRLSGVFEEIGDEVLEDMEKEIEEIQRGLEEDKEDISLERIKELAMRGIEVEKNETNEKSIALEAYRKKRRPHLKRLIIPLVAAVGLSVGVIATTHYSETLSSLFGQFFPYSEQVQSIGKSMSASGVTLTAEGAFIDKKSGLFIASLRKEDGTSFENGTEIGQMSLQTQKPGSMGWSVSNILSDDGKQLNCIVDLSSSQQLSGQQLILKAEDLKVWRRLEAVSKINLTEISKTPIEANWRNHDSEDGLKIKLSEDIEGITLDRINWSEQKLEIITSYADRKNIEHQSASFSLVDTETGQVYEAAQSEHYWSEEEALNKDYTTFIGVTELDLEHLALKVNMNYYEVTMQGSWEVGFKLDDNKMIKTKKVNQIVKSGENKCFVKKVEISALGVTIQGTKLSAAIEQLEDISLQMKDGTSIKLWNSGMNSSFGKFNMYYKVEIDEEAPLEQGEMGTMESNAFNLRQFIEIEDVESIVIEGITIPL